MGGDADANESERDGHGSGSDRRLVTIGGRKVGDCIRNLKNAPQDHFHEMCLSAPGHIPPFMGGRYWTNACPTCPIKDRCTTGKERRLSRWEHEHVLDAVQRRLDENPQAMRQRRETVEHPFGTIKAWMGATHFLMKRLRNVRTEMALNVLAYNLTRVMNILGIRPLIAAIRA